MSIAMARQMNERQMKDSFQVADSTWAAVGDAVKCRFTENQFKGATESTQGARVVSEVDGEVALPIGTAVAAKDRAIITLLSGEVIKVFVVNAPLPVSNQSQYSIQVKRQQ